MVKQRLDKFLADQHPDISRSAIAKYIQRGDVKVDGKAVIIPATLIDDSNDIDFTPIMRPDYSTEIADFAARNVIYMNNRVIVIDKPAGMLVHAKGGIDPEFTVADFARAKYNADEAAENASNRIGIVHRLDRATSGVMILARDNAAASFLARQFSDRKAHKTYLAVTEQAPKEPAAKLDLPLSRNPRRPATFMVNAKGKPATTIYQTLEVYSDGRALVELHPQTGRTHQLRVHLAYIGCPIVGDHIYGDGHYDDRLMLHAQKLEITILADDGTHERRVFTAKVPEEFIRYGK